MKLTRKTKTFLKNALTVVLAFALIIGVVSLFGGLGKDEDGYKTIHPTYTVGSIDTTTGKSITDDETSLYTSNVIPCTGLKLATDFESDITYDVIVYNEENEFVSAETGLTGYNEIVLEEDTYGVRIVIHVLNDEDGKIGMFEKLTYANQLEVKTTDKVFKTE